MALSATPIQTKKGNTGNSTTATSLVLTLGSAPTAGNILVLGFVDASVTNRLYGITQTGVTWTYYPVLNTTTGNTVLAVGRVFASAGTTITIARLDTSSFTSMAAVVAEFSGTNIRLDKQVGATGNSASPATGATATLDTANELLVAALSSRGQFSTATTVFSSPTNSFAIIDQDNTTVNTANADRALCLLAQVVSSTSGVSAGATITSAQWGAEQMTFQETGGTGVKKSRLQLGQA